MTKQELRRHIRALKQAMTEEEICCASEKLGQLLAESPLYQQANTVYFYLPYNQEVRTVPMVERAFREGKRVAVPKIYGDEMRFIYLTDLDQVGPGYRGIPEPVGDEPVAQDPTALVLMPGLAFDRQGRRVGYGGGYYDRFLAQEPNHPTIALCYRFQLMDQLETEEFDIPVDLVLWA